MRAKHHRVLLTFSGSSITSVEMVVLYSTCKCSIGQQYMKHISKLLKGGAREDSGRLRKVKTSCTTDPQKVACKIETVVAYTAKKHYFAKVEKTFLPEAL